MSIDLSKMPKLGFGCMRLPVKDDEIDIEQMKEMVDLYLNAGLNYFDTAYVYHRGKSEVAIKEAIIDRYPRESFILADKLPAWEIHSKEDRDRIFNEQLERTGAGYFDMYLLHSVEDGNIHIYRENDCFEWAKAKRDEGLIIHFGFSFHGTPGLLKELLDEHPEVEFVQIQLNYADWDNPKVRSGELHQILCERNIPMVIMEPIKGGTLAKLRPELEAHYLEAEPNKSIASWALRFVGSLPGVMTILSGMSALEQMKDNVNTFTHFEPLNEKEKELIDQVVKEMFSVEQIGCTACRYCTEGCPMNIAIPDIFRIVNEHTIYENVDKAKFSYGFLLNKDHGKASDCLQCGQCESVCPQHLPIIELMQKASKLLDERDRL